MVPILSLLVILFLSLIVTRIATIALVHTGLSNQTARLQARSAFTGCGFTTKESEEMVNHPVRRRILMLLMLFGHVGVVTVLSSMVLSFISLHKDPEWYWKVGILLLGLIILWCLCRSSWVDNRMSRIVEWMLRRYTNLDVRDYAHLFHLADDYKIAEVFVDPDGWVAGKQLKKSGLRDEGLVVLGIQRKKGGYIGAPQGDTILQVGDQLIVYGRKELIDDLNQRQTGKDGDKAHKEALKAQKKIIKEEKSE